MSVSCTQQVDEVIQDILFVPYAAGDDEIAPGQGEPLIKNGETMGAAPDYCRLTTDLSVGKLAAGKDDKNIVSEEQTSLMNADEMEKNILV